uniref:Uncharacterized protein n=1 Tax=Graphocephala atropunctata TaxID=36148 RepID=A0A1B6M5P9_9HEMI
MDYVVRITSLIDSMDALNKRRAKLLEGYIEIERVNIDLHNLLAVEGKATESSVPPGMLKTGSEKDLPAMLPKIARVLQDMRQDLVLLGSLRAFLASLRQLNRFVLLTGTPFSGQVDAKNPLRGG